MKIWTNTKTLDGFLDGFDFTANASVADIALIGGKSIDLGSFPNLKGIFKCGIGTDNVPFAEAERRGIKIGLPSKGTAEYIFEETACFACYLCLKLLYAAVGDVDLWEKFPRDALSQKKVLVIGTGRIGSRVASKMNAFAQIETYDISVNAPEDLFELLPKADCVTLHIPKTEETIGFLDEEKLTLMKRGAGLVNTSRGAIVDEDALYNELAAERLRAAFDVFWQEPYTGRLRDLPTDRFFMTPHVASTCREFLEGLADDFRLFIQNF